MLYILKHPATALVIQLDPFALSKLQAIRLFHRGNMIVYQSVRNQIFQYQKLHFHTKNEIYIKENAIVEV